MDLYIKPSKDRHLENKFNLTLLNFTWEALNLTDDILTIQLKFISPIDISTQMEHDKLVVHIFANSSLYLGLTGEHVLRKKIVPQLYDNQNTANMIKTAEGMSLGSRNLLILQFLLRAIFEGCEYFMVAFVKSLQLIVHLPILTVIFPSNVAKFFSILVPIATFDVLSPDWTTRLVFEFDYKGHEK